MFWNPCTCPCQCLKSASGLSSCHDLRCWHTVEMIWASVLLTQPAHCLTSCHLPTPALLLPLAPPLWRGRWWQRLPAPTGLHIKLKRVWHQPHCTHLACGRLGRHQPASELRRLKPMLDQADEPTPWSPSSMMEWCMRLILLLNSWEHPQAWLPGVYVSKHTVNGWATTSIAQPVFRHAYRRVNELKNLFRIVRPWVRLPSLLCWTWSWMVTYKHLMSISKCFTLTLSTLTPWLKPWNISAYRTTSHVPSTYNLSPVNMHPVGFKFSGNIFCACFPQKLSMNLRLGCPAHLSKRWSPAPLAQPPCT